MSHDTSGDVRLPHVNDLQPDVATFMIAWAFDETPRYARGAGPRPPSGHPAPDGNQGG